MKRTMYVNGKAVGSGMWKLQSVKNYCAKKRIELKSAYSIESSADGAAADTLDLSTGEYSYGAKHDYL